MSFTKKDRNIRSDSGNIHPHHEPDGPLGSAKFAAIVAAALQREFGIRNSAVKNVVALTHANERAVKNWFSAKNAPAGPHLVSLMRHSDAVLETLLMLTGRVELLKAKKFSDARRTLEEIVVMLRNMDGA